MDGNQALKLKVTTFLIAASVTAEKADDITRTTLYRNKAKFVLNNAIQELGKTDKLFAAIWQKDENAVITIFEAFQGIVENLAMCKPSELVKLHILIRDALADPEFLGKPVPMRRLDTDLVNTKRVGSELHIWVTNPTRFLKLKEEEVEWEAVIRKEIFIKLKNSGLRQLATKHKDRLEMTDDTVVWTLASSETDSVYLALNSNGDVLKLKASRNYRGRVSNF